MKIIFIFSCSGMFRNVPACSGMFRVPGFIDGLLYVLRSVTFYEMVALSNTPIRSTVYNKTKAELKIFRKDER